MSGRRGRPLSSSHLLIYGNETIWILLDFSPLFSSSLFLSPVFCFLVISSSSSFFLNDHFCLSLIQFAISRRFNRLTWQFEWLSGDLIFISWLAGRGGSGGGGIKGSGEGEGFSAIILFDSWDSYSRKIKKIGKIGKIGNLGNFGNAQRHLSIDSWKLKMNC